MKNVFESHIKTLILAPLCSLLLSCQLNTEIFYDGDSSLGKQNVSIETSADGSGSKIENLNVHTNSPDTNFYALSRDDNQALIGPVKVKWSLVGSFGQLNIQQGGHQAVLTNLVLGSGSIEVEYEGQITIIQVDVTPPPFILSVEPLYDNGADWNDYIKNTSSPVVDETKASCLGTESNGSLASCFNGGVYRALRIPSLSSCSNLTGEDNLDYFNWVCDDSTGGVIFYSRALKPGIGLKDLITNSGWKMNFFTLYESSTYVNKSDPAVWWNNPVKALPDNSAAVAMNLPDGTDAGNTVYFADGVVETNGYNLNADKLSVVALEGSTIKYSHSSTPNCNAATGEQDGSEDTINLLCSGSQKFLWIEGDLNSSGGAAAANGVYFQNVFHSTLNDIELSGSSSYGVFFLNSDSNNLRHISLHSDTMFFETSHFNRIKSLKIGLGYLELHFSQFNTFYGLTIGNSDSTGFKYGWDLAKGNILVKGVVANAAGFGHYNFDGALNITTHFTITNSGNVGISEFDIHEGNLYNNILTMNSNGYGVRLALGTIGTKLSNLASVDNLSTDVYIESENSTQMLNTLLVGAGIGPNFRCEVNGGVTTPGIEDGSCTISGTDGSSDYSYSGSDALLRINKTAANSFVGWAISDSVNRSPGASISGEIGYSDILDWVNFENDFRTWGKKGSAFPAADNRGHCNSGNCQIWDWRLRATDTMFLKRTFDGGNLNSDFNVGGACPNAVQGDLTLKGYSREVLNDGDGNEDGLCNGGENCYNDIFLVNAIEIIDDFKGDEDGLCESNEACIYTPNYGAYQGHGDLEGPCNFSDGVGADKVIDVEMYQYQTNGV